MARQRELQQPRLRFEFKLLVDDMVSDLQQEAQLRGVTIQQHVYDILRMRWLVKQGIHVDPLWVEPEQACQKVPPAQQTTDKQHTESTMT